MIEKKVRKYKWIVIAVIVALTATMLIGVGCAGPQFPPPSRDDEHTTRGEFTGDQLPPTEPVALEIDASDVCSSMAVEGYSYQIPESVRGYNAGFNGEVKLDLDGDGQDEVVRAYVGNSGWVEDPNHGGFAEPPAKPIIVKIFSGTQDCPKEVFSYKGVDRPDGLHEWGGNLVWGMMTFLNFWGDGANAVLINEVSYGGGSGAVQRLTFFTYREGQYKLIKGPEFDRYKFVGENGLGNKIIVAERRWDWSIPDYCAGCASKMQFMIYAWNGESYDKTEAVITQNKYLSETIDEILQQEPSVLDLHQYR